MTPDSVSIEQFQEIIETKLSSRFPLQVSTTVRDNTFHILLDYKSDVMWDQTAAIQLISDTAAHQCPPPISRVRIFGRVQGEPKPQWKRSLDLVRSQMEPSPTPVPQDPVSFAPEAQQDPHPIESPPTTRPSSSATPSPSLETQPLSSLSFSTQTLNQSLSTRSLPPSFDTDEEKPQLHTSAASPLLAGRYTVHKRLGAGGFGRTYLAQDTQRPGHPICVVKQLHLHIEDRPDLFEKARELFNLEAETLERLGKHDQIPQLLAYFEEKGQFYLVQEFIEGAPLSHAVQSHRFTEASAIELLKDLLNVLAFVHNHHFIHRDVKPDNIICRASDNKPVLIDFGAGKQLQADVVGEDAHSVAIGTLGYIAPEQMMGSPRLNSDLYALGMVIVECLSGISPSELQSDPATGEVNWREHTTVSEALAEVLDGLLRTQYSQRFQSATEVLDALESRLSPTVIAEEVPTWRQTLATLSRPSSLAMVGAGIIGLGSLAFGASWFRLQQTSLTARQQYQVGFLETQANQWQQAQKAYQAALDTLRIYPAAQAALAHVSDRLVRLEEQVQNYEEAVLSNTADDQLRQVYGITLTQTGDLDRAITLLSTAVDSGSFPPPEQARIFYYLGRAYAQQQNWPQAIEFYQQALALDPNNTAALLYLGVALNHRGDLQEAMDPLTAAVEQDPNNGLAYYYRGQGWADLQEWEIAIAFYIVA